MGRLITLEDARMADWRDVPTGRLRTTYFLDSPAGTELPQCFRVENTPHRHLDTHFHEVDQFQVILEGSGTLGKHDLAPCLVHFARAYTPYGPIVAGAEGLAWLSIRMRHDDGAQYMPASRAALDAVEDRDPWQWSERVAFDDIPTDGVLHGLSGLRDAHGLGAFALRLGPGMTATLPDPSDTGGQCVVMVRGGVLRDGGETRSLATMMNGPHDGPVEVTAGAQGLDALVLDFPRVRSAAARAAPQQARPEPPQPPSHAGAHAAAAAAGAAASKLWHCAPCGYVYDESAGSPEDGIAPGTPFDALPSGWHCPDCGAGRDDFTELDF